MATRARWCEQIEGRLDVDQSDPELVTLIQRAIEDIAVGKQCACTASSQVGIDRRSDPIEMFRGEFVQEATDLVIAGAGMDFAFRRFYRNQAVYFGPLGANWDFSYNLHIRQTGTSLLRSSGELRDDLYTQHPKFGQSGFSYWVPPDGRNGIIEASGTSFAWRSPGGVRCVYEQHPADPLFHRVSRIDDRFGNYLSFTYQQEQLLRVEINNPARFVAFGYDALNRIILVQDHTSRKWTYGYDDFGDLISVTSPATADYPQGLTTCYEYSSIDYSAPLQHNIVRVTDPAGQVYLENEYGADGGLLSFNRVVRQRQGNGEYTFEYEAVIEEFEFDYADAERPFIQVNQTLRNGQPVHFVYNKFGNLLLREEYVWQVDLQALLQWRYRYNQDGSLVGALTPEGRLTQYYYGRDDYLKVYGVTDEQVATDDHLTSELRMGFADLLAVIRRGRRYDFLQMDMSRGVWGDFFPPPLAPPDAEDIVVKNTYEPDFHQLLTTSDPRFTASADPRFLESAPYDLHLTRYAYSALPLKILSGVEYPDTTFPSPLPDGTTGLTNARDQYLQYDSRGRLERAQDPEGNVTGNDYYQGGATEPRVGYLRSSTRDVNNLSLTTTYDVNPVGLRTGVQNPGGARTTFTVNELDQVVERVSAGPGFKTKFLFNENGLLKRQERDNLDDTGQPSPEGNEIRFFKYDEQNNLLKETIRGADPARRHVVSHRYDGSDCQVATVFPLGNRIRFEYDERSLLSSTTRGASSALASTTRNVYDGDGRRSGFIDGRGNRTQYVYDALGRLASTTDALGNVQQSEYDKLGNTLIDRFFEKRADGTYHLLRRTEYGYDERGSRVKKTEFLFAEPILTDDIGLAPDAEFTVSEGQGAVTPLVTQFFYDRNKRLFRILNPLGHETAWQFDGANRTILERDNLGNYVQTFYDANSNVVRADRHELILDPATGAVLGEEVFSTLQGYDPLDRRTTTTDGLGNITTYTYDSRDHLCSVTDPLGNVRRYKYDVFNRKTFEVAELTQSGLGGGTRLPDIATQSIFDDNDRLTSFVDGNGNATGFGYDDLNRRYQTTYSDQSAVQLTYDADDHVIVQQDNNELQVVFQIDPLGRRTRVDLDRSAVNPLFSYPAGAEQFEQYSYDGLGRPLTCTNDFCAIVSQFDSLGRAYNESIQFTIPYPAPPGALTLQRVYDGLSNRTDVTYPSGRAVHYRYDDLGRIDRIVNVAKGAGYPGSGTFAGQYQIAAYAYRGQRLGTATYGNQTTCEFAYDGLGRPISFRNASGGNVFLELQQLFDGAGNRRFQLETPSVAGQANGERYEFDSLYRLTRFAPQPIAPVNPAQFAPPNAPLGVNALIGQQAIDAAIGPLAQNPPNFAYGYDSVGNRLEERLPGQAPVVYAANSLNQYGSAGGTPLQYDLNGNLIDDGLFTYSYNYRNQLVQAIRKATNAEEARLLYDASGRLIAVRESGQVTVLISDGVNVIEEYRGGNVTSQYVYEDGIDRRCQLAAGGDEWWYHCDLLSSSRLLSDSAGNPLPKRYEYEPFGTLLSGPPHSNAYLYAGKRLITSLGLYDSRARQYSPPLGRFLQRDPMGVSEGPNLYVYAGNNPVTFLDATGREKTQPAGSENEPQWGWEPGSPTVSPTGAPFGGTEGGPGSGGDLVPAVPDKATLQFDLDFELGMAKIDRLLGKPTQADLEEAAAQRAIAARDGPQLWEARPLLATDDAFLQQMERTGSLQSIVEFGLLPVLEFKAVEFAGYLWRGSSVIYGRLNPLTGEMYVGQAKTWERYLLRQGEHDLTLGVQHEFSVLERPWPGARGIAVDVAEETWIRRAGGPLNQGGWLRNARYQMSEDSFRLFGGTELKTTPPLP